MLNDNQLFGPVIIGNWSLFQTLNIADNAFSGSVPSLAQFPQLGVVHLSHNRLSGDFPSLPIGLFECDAIRDDGMEGNCFNTCPAICCAPNTTICASVAASTTSSEEESTSTFVSTSTEASTSTESSTESSSRISSASSTTTTSHHNSMTSAAAHRGTPGALGIGLGIGGGIVALAVVGACLFLRCAPSAAGSRGSRFRKLENNTQPPTEQHDQSIDSI
jgi:hypothetical protein